jgi:hypothetical protein
LRRRLIIIIALAFPIALFACRDILGISGETITDAGDAGDASVEDVVSDVTNDTSIPSECGTITVLTPAQGGEVVALVADSNGVFWAEEKSSGTTIYEWGKTAPLASPTADLVDLRIDDGYVYWSTWDQSQAAGPQLGAFQRDAGTSIAPTTFPNITAGRMATDGNRLYFGTWLQHDGGSIYAFQLPLSGGGLQAIPIATGLDSPYHVALTGNQLYFDQGADDGGEGKRLSVVDVIDGSVSEVTDSGFIPVDDLVALGGFAYWSQTNVNLVQRSDQAGYQTIIHPRSLSIEPGGKYFFVASNDTQLIRVSTDVKDTNWPMCFDAGQTGQVTGVAAIANRTYFAAKVSGVWQIFQLDY